MSIYSVINYFCSIRRETFYQDYIFDLSLLDFRMGLHIFEDLLSQFWCVFLLLCDYAQLLQQIFILTLTVYNLLWRLWLFKIYRRIAIQDMRYLSALSWDIFMSVFLLDSKKVYRLHLRVDCLRIPFDKANMTMREDPFSVPSIYR